MRWILLVVVAAAAAIALSSGTGTADAYPAKDCVGKQGKKKCKTVCRTKLPDGALLDHDDGSIVTVTETDGRKRRFKCTNGEWHIVKLVLGSRAFELTTRK